LEESHLVLLLFSVSVSPRPSCF